MNRSYPAFRWAGFGLMPLALGMKLLSLAALGLVAAFIAMRRMQRIEDSTRTRLLLIISFSVLANALALIEPWSSKLPWLAWIWTAAGFAGPIAYLLLARGGIAISRSHGDASSERSWQLCLWIGLPLTLSTSLLLLAWWVLAGSSHALHFENHNLFVVMGSTLIFTLPGVLLFHALFATERVVNTALGKKVRLLVRVLAHPGTAMVLAFLFLTPSLILVPAAIHYAVTPNFSQFVAQNRSPLSFDPPDGIQVVERHTGSVYISGPWLDPGMETQWQTDGRLGYDLSVELTRPGTTLLTLTNSLEIKVEPPAYEDFRELRVSTDLKAIDPRFHLALTVFLHHQTSSSKVAGAPAPALEFMVRVALMAGAGDTVVETLLVNDLPSRLVPASMSAGALSYIWQARGKFELIPDCRGEHCLSPRVRYDAQQRFDIATEEYSYAMKAALTIKLQTTEPVHKTGLYVESKSQNKSKEIAWNGAPW